MSKQQVIEDYINTIVGATVTTSALVLATKCSLPTVLSYIKNNPTRFEKVRRGTYTILSASLSTQTPNNNTLPTHEW